MVRSAHVAPTVASHTPAPAIRHTMVGMFGPRIAPDRGRATEPVLPPPRSSVNDSGLVWIWGDYWGRNSINSRRVSVDPPAAQTSAVFTGDASSELAWLCVCARS